MRSALQNGGRWRRQRLGATRLLFRNSAYLRRQAWPASLDHKHIAISSVCVAPSAAISSVCAAQKHGNIKSLYGAHQSNIKCVRRPEAWQYRVCVAPRRAISSVRAAREHSNIECVWPQAPQYRVCAQRRGMAISNLCIPHAEQYQVCMPPRGIAI